MIGLIADTAKSDPGLNSLLEAAREYGAVYLMAKKRQKGCDGMGELATLKEEFKDVIDRMIQYCKEKKYITEDIVWTLDSVAEEIERL